MTIPQKIRNTGLYGREKRIGEKPCRTLEEAQGERGPLPYSYENRRPWETQKNM